MFYPLTMCALQIVFMIMIIQHIQSNSLQFSVERHYKWKHKMLIIQKPVSVTYIS